MNYVPLDAIDAVPQLRRGRVWCGVCRRTIKVNVAECFKRGWPECCGYTMTIDSPAERLAPQTAHQGGYQIPALPELDESPVANIVRAAHCWQLVEELRREECDAVTIHNDNPDFNMGPGAIIICEGEWCGSDEPFGLQFTGATILEALEKAVAARREAKNPQAESAAP